MLNLARVLCVVSMIAVAGCIPAIPGGEVVKSDKSRESSPDTSDLAEFVAGNTAFALDLYGALSGEGENLFLSPHSISLALAMTYAGARGETEQQMADALHFTLPQERLHPAANALDLELASRGEGAAGTDGEGFRLNIVNAIWGQKDFAFLASFLDVLAVNYGAGLRTLDFASEPEPSRQTINNWVSAQTEERIKDLIPAGVITALTRLVLTNAVYFNAAWASPFEELATRDQPFDLLDGTQTTVPMMSQMEAFKYAAGQGYQAVELPYDGNELSMVILLPDAGGFAAFEASLDAQRLATILGDLALEQMTLSLPKFTFESAFGLGEVLRQMGMTDAFDPTVADLSGIDGLRDLYIAAVLHKAFVAVDEAGTEAAAATAVVISLTGLPDPGIPVTVDRPFIFLIRDIETGAILFMGRVVNPAA